MLIELKMKSWRQHTDRTIHFTSGLNAIRGANEAGKTSTMMAVNYCLWGVKAVPLSLEELVTWGQPVKNLKVEVVIKVGTEMYHFTRSKAGAECQHSGGIVTGQNEVTKFATELLKADADLASKLMFASQKGLNSLLETGPTALSGYIEDLAGMNLFDRLLDLIQRKLSTGPTTALDNAVANLENTVAAGVPEVPNVDALNAAIAETEVEIKRQELILEVQKAGATKTADMYSDAKAKADLRVTVTANLNRAVNLMEHHTNQQATLEKAAAGEVDEARIAALESSIKDETLNAKRYATYTRFSKLLETYPEDDWGGTLATLVAERNTTREQCGDLQKSYSELLSEVRVAQAKKVTSSVCGFCDQDMSKFPEVAKKNAEIEALIEAKQGEIADLGVKRKEADEYLKDLESVLRSAEPFSDFAKANADHVTVDETHVPWVLAWKGDVPEAGQDVKALQAELTKLKAAKQAVATAVAQLEPARQALIEDAETVKTLQEQLDALPTYNNLEILKANKESAEQAMKATQADINEMIKGIQETESQKSRLYAEHAVAKRGFEAAELSLLVKKQERDELVFNNTLVKKVKAARPLVAAKLWSIVLASTSQMFSRMRGEASIVTKGTDAFLINGYSSKALSGSALDLLGLSLRVSLIKTFIPDCSILALDEPMAASDDNRTVSMLGFMSSCDFEQVLLVTHEAVSESVANNLIMI